MCLPVLNPEKIKGVFDFLRAEAPVDVVGVGQLFDYVDRTWIRGHWSPAKWSVFRRIIRTNNDCDGLHNRWNLMAKGKKEFYWVLSILVKEAKRIERSAAQIQHGYDVRVRTAANRKKEAELFKLWDEYQEGTLTSMQLVKWAVKLLKRHFPTYALVDEPEEEPEEEL